jgi:hypothetical protein
MPTQAVLTNVEALERESTLETFDGIGLDAADGLWRLVFSSALSAGSGSGGGASSQSLPIFQTPDAQLNSFGPGSQVGQVYARISSRKKKLENIVEVRVVRACSQQASAEKCEVCGGREQAGKEYTSMP